jgi:hypothetical protein
VRYDNVIYECTRTDDHDDNHACHGFMIPASMWRLDTGGSAAPEAKP